MRRAGSPSTPRHWQCSMHSAPVWKNSPPSAGSASTPTGSCSPVNPTVRSHSIPTRSPATSAGSVTGSGSPDVRLHDLRHLHATQLLAAGVPVRTVSGRLGHANAATTLNVYAHFLEASDRDAADVIGGPAGLTTQPDSRRNDGTCDLVRYARESVAPGLGRSAALHLSRGLRFCVAKCAGSGRASRVSNRRSCALLGEV